MYESQNYCRQGYHKNGCNMKIIDTNNKECDGTSLDDTNDYGCHRDMKMLNSSSCECSLKKSRGEDREYLRLVASADQHLDTKLQRSKTKKHKSRSALTFPKTRKLQRQQDLFNLDTSPNGFGTQPYAYCLDPGKYGEKNLENPSKNQTKDRPIPEYRESTKNEKGGMRMKEKRQNNEKYRCKTQKYLGQIEDLNNQLSQFKIDKIPEKIMDNQKRKNSSEAKLCQQYFDNGDNENEEDDEEEDKVLEEELAKITVYDPYVNSKHVTKTPDRMTSFTETTSVAEEMDKRGPNNVQRVIDSAVMREHAYGENRNLRRVHDDLMSSEETMSEHEETLCDSPSRRHHDSDYINHLKTLRLRYLHHIQDELNNLFDLEELFESLTINNVKLDGKPGRPVTRAAGLQ